MPTSMTAATCTMGYMYNHEACTMKHAHRLPTEQKIVLVIWILLASMVGGALSSCRSVAIYGLKHADCENRGFQSVPQDQDHDIKVLQLADNKIQYLEIDAFSRYKSLQRIYLARNEIERIAPDAFRDLHMLQTLDLGNNKLSEVPWQAFKHLPSLRTLEMKSNPIRHITNNSFQFLSKIERIDFENCWLNRVEPHAFRGLLNLKEINIVNNDLKTLSSEMKMYLPKSLHIFRLYWNNWNCDCKLRWLLEWLTKRNVNWHFPGKTPLCKAPEMIKDVHWVDLQPDRFACASDIIIKNTSYDLIIGANRTIVCEVFGDPPPEVTWEKDSHVIDELTNPAKYILKVERNSHKLWSKLTVCNLRVSDAGSYKCTAKNLAGQSSVTYVLRERPATAATPGETSSKGVNLSIIIAIAVGGSCVVLAIIICAVYLICKNYHKRHAYKVRNYNKKPAKNKQPKKEKPRFEDEEQAIIKENKENDKGAASAATQLLKKKKKEQEKELVKEFYKETDIATPPVVCNDVHHADKKENNKEFKMKIFTSYEDEERSRRSAELPSPSAEAMATAAAAAADTRAHHNHKPNCNNIQEVTPDLLKTQKQQLVPNHRSPTEPNHISHSHQKRAEENPYAKPSDLRPGVLPNKQQSRSAEDLLDGSRDSDIKARCKTLGAPRSPNLRHSDGSRHDTSPCSNPICLKDQEAGVKSATSTPKPHIKNSQSMGGIQGRAADDSGIDIVPSGRGGMHKASDKYATLPSKPRQGILHNGNSSRTTQYGVRFPDDPSPGSPSNSPSKSPTYQYQTGGRPAKGQLVTCHVSPTRTPIPKYHPQIIRGTISAGGSTGYMPPKKGSRVTSPASSDHSGEFSPSPSRPGSRTFASTSLDDILSPPFGGVETKTKTATQKKLPKPGEKDEYGTAV